MVEELSCAGDFTDCRGSLDNLLCTQQSVKDSKVLLREAWLVFWFYIQIMQCIQTREHVCCTSYLCMEHAFKKELKIRIH